MYEGFTALPKIVQHKLYTKNFPYIKIFDRLCDKLNNLNYIYHKSSLITSIIRYKSPLVLPCAVSFGFGPLGPPFPPSLPPSLLPPSRYFYWTIPVLIIGWCGDLSSSDNYSVNYPSKSDLQRADLEYQTLTGDRSGRILTPVQLRTAALPLYIDRHILHLTGDLYLWLHADLHLHPPPPTLTVVCK